MATIKNWFSEFQRGRTSVFYEPRPGAPKTATTEDNVTKIHDLVLADVGAMGAAFAHSGQQTQP